MKRLIITALACLLPFAAHAGGDAEAGQKKAAQTCATCHGPKGFAVSPEFPNLAGQNPDYIVAALHHYKNGRRKNPIMQGQVANLTERDIEDLAAYFSGQRGLYVKE